MKSCTRTATVEDRNVRLRRGNPQVAGNSLSFNGIRSYEGGA